MMTIDLEDLIALDAVGALDAEERRLYEQALTGAPAPVRAQAAAFREVAALIATVSPPVAVPRADLKQQLLAKLSAPSPEPPPGFTFRLADEDDWVPMRIPGIRMKMLSMNRERGYATLLLDVEPGACFPAHHHSGAEECYVISGSVFASGRRMTAGDFLHADAGSDHDELWTDEGCRVLLVVSPQDYFPERQA